MALAVPKDNVEITGLSYTVAGAALHFGLTVRQLNWYIKRGYVFPSRRPPEGRGPTHARLFSVGDMREIAALAALRNAGIAPQRAGEILSLLRTHRVDLTRAAVVVGNDDHVYVVDETEPVYDLLRGRGLQCAFALMLGFGEPVRERRVTRRRRQTWAPAFHGLTRARKTA